MRRGTPELMEVNSLSAIAHLIAHRPNRIKQLVVYTAPDPLKRRVSDLQQQARQAGIAVTSSPQKGRGGEPMVAYLEPFEYTDFREFLSEMEGRRHALVLALDHLQDPQNFGALCRSAEALGV